MPLVLTRALKHFPAPPALCRSPYVRGQIIVAGDVEKSALNEETAARSVPSRVDVLLRHRLWRADMHPADVCRTQLRRELGLVAGRCAPRVAVGAAVCCLRARAGAVRSASAQAGAMI